MITNSVLLSFISNQTAASAKNVKSSSVSDENFPKFDRVLSDRISKKSSKRDIPEVSDKPVKTFKEVEESRTRLNKKETVKPDTAKSETVKDDTDGKVAKDDKKLNNVKEKAVIKAVAELLGITPEELQSVLEKCDVKPSELADPSSCALAVSRISDMLNLNSEQRQSFSEAAVKISHVVSSYVGEILPDTGNRDKSNWVKVEGLDVEVVDESESDISSDIGKVEKALDTKLHQVVSDLRQKVEMPFDSIALKVKKLFEDTALLNQADRVVEEKMSDGEESSDANAEQSIESTSSNVSTAINSPGLASAAISTEAGQNEESAVINPVGSVDIHKGINSLKSSVANSDAKVVKNEIMNQIIEKAKVLLDGQKSEMIMELKPESLGKLALKVVTENGIVMAKFVAENQQVKEVIESNMQVLKDSLEKQGMNVQGFSVSVGQDSGRGSNMRRDFGSGKGSQEKSSREANMVDGTLVAGGAESINPYMVSESSVDFKA